MGRECFRDKENSQVWLRPETGAEGDGRALNVRPRHWVESYLHFVR